MRSGFIILLISTLLFGGGYFYYVAQAVCPAPLEYSIGEIDESFGLSFDELRLALADAESLWEEGTGQNLFTYDENAKFSVNLIYDDRQAYTDAEGNFKNRLNKTQSVSDRLNATYAKLVNNYDGLQKVYSQRADRYETNLSAYNTQVEQYNQEGGVTSELYEALQERKVELDTQQASLNTLSDQLNELVSQINTIGEQGNMIVETYNKGVREYNHTFGESREFTQGTYNSSKRIDIFSYTDTQELRLVLAHELGHALSLDHVANEKSVMYFLIGAQSLKKLALTKEDMGEFVRVCSKQSFWDTIKASIK